jgi:hypothetical protein
MEPQQKTDHKGNQLPYILNKENNNRNFKSEKYYVLQWRTS